MYFVYCTSKKAIIFLGPKVMLKNNSDVMEDGGHKNVSQIDLKQNGLVRDPSLASGFSRFYLVLDIFWEMQIFAKKSRF